MSEGGTLPWKSQKIVDCSPPLDSFLSCLPPPPVGYIWELELRGEEGKQWVLKKYEKDTSVGENVVIFQNFSCIMHIVMPYDTLQGVCLKYNVRAVDLRRHNTFSGSNIRAFKVLKIPVEAGAPVNMQEGSPEVLIQIFKNETNESTMEAKFYLEEANWDLQKAISDYKGDEAFEREAAAAAAAIAAATEAAARSEASIRVVQAAKIEHAKMVAPVAIVDTLREVELSVFESVSSSSIETCDQKVPLLA